MDSSFRVSPYTKGNFATELAQACCRASDVQENRRFGYLADYLVAIQVRTIVSEDDYIDADYLDDYASFYAKSFEKISNRCRRLHFFTSDFDELIFRAVLLGKLSEDNLSQHYAGFIVARPLPTAIIGRTVLQTYSSDSGRRQYSAVRTYRVNLYGLLLEIRSLAFQEQDTSLAACATVALWTCFQKAQDLFGTAAPTPAAITRSANQLLLTDRPFPSRGLQIQQICNAIASVGLDPEFYTVTPDLPLVSLIYSYVRLGLPVLAVVKVGAEGHAIAINGYSLRDTKQLQCEAANVNSLLPPLIGLRIDEFYGHDDQNGPFCRLKIVAPDSGLQTVKFTDTGWNVDIIPIYIVVPVYPKIRTGFREVKDWLPKISAVMSWAVKPHQTEWDIYLTRSNDLKKEVRDGSISIPEPLRERLLFVGLPKYLWRCTLRVSGQVKFEMLLDTTAMVKGFPISLVWWNDSAMRDSVMPTLSNPANEQTLIQMLGTRLFEVMKDS